MKKNFWGYNIAQTDIVLSALRQENENLNAIISDLKSEIELLKVKKETKQKES